MRNITVELQVDWEDYDDVIDELIVEDAIDIKKDGVSLKVLQNPFGDNEQFKSFENWILDNSYEYNSGLWYHKDDLDGEHPLSLSNLYNLYIKDNK